jgi:ABC-type cobalamin/Fe3+-siderophores transport system ATPase subunit
MESNTRQDDNRTGNMLFERVTVVAGLTDSPGDVCAAVARYDNITGEFTVEFVHDFELALTGSDVGLIAVDCPIGFPRALARVAAMPSYRGLINDLASGRRTELLTVGARSSTTSPFSRASTRNIARDFRLSPDELLRECDKATTQRMHLDVVFSVRHTRRAGRSPLAVLNAFNGVDPNKLLIWPFDGPIAELAARSLPVIAEASAQEAESQLRVGVGPGTGKTKRNASDRRGASASLASAYRLERIRLSEDQSALMNAGFATVFEFDAALILVAVLRALRTGIAEPDDDAARSTEGWVLGQPYPRQVRTPTPLQLLTSRTRKTERYSIETLECWSNTDRVRLELARPDTSNRRGAVNVICGLNNSGKSFLLDQIRRTLDGRSTNQNVRIEPAPPRGESRVLSVGKGWAVADDVGVANLSQTAASLSVSPRLGEYRRIGLALIVSQITPYLKSDHKDTEAILTDPRIRAEIEQVFDIEDTVYRCKGEPVLIERLEYLLGARLYFRCSRRHERSNSWMFEFVLVDRDGMTIPFKQWSDGQKMLFYILAALHFFEPDVVLFDEIENHLHPAMISEVLDALHAQPTQSIVATHHPHLVFSRFADRVFYLETRRPGPSPDPPERLPYSKRHTDKGFPRIVKVIEKDLDRIGAAYKLFAQADEQLLRQAGYLQSQATLALFEAIARVFNYPAVPATVRSLPDAQTLQLAERFRGFLSTKRDRTIKVLDYGSGVGRQVIEMGKLSEWQLGGHVEWTCYEPRSENVAVLRQKFSDVAGVDIVQNIASLPASSFDVCVLANVLHELNPRQFAAAVIDADHLVSTTGGSIAVLELYPLLHPEAYAVPYEAATLLDIFRHAGFIADSGSIAVRSEAQAYWLWARRRVLEPPLGEGVQAIVEAAWETILSRVLAGYAAIGRPVSVADHVRALSYLTTVASIASWRDGYWSD